jgi:hypothetical protein
MRSATSLEGDNHRLRVGRGRARGTGRGLCEMSARAITGLGCGTFETCAAMLLPILFKL